MENGKVEKSISARFRVKGYPLMPRFTYKIDIESNIQTHRIGKSHIHLLNTIWMYAVQLPSNNDISYKICIMNYIKKGIFAQLFAVSDMEKSCVIECLFLEF